MLLDGPRNMSVTYFEPQPDPSELPGVVPSPFANTAPHPLARRAAEELRACVTPREGKMFGVLVVADREGRIGYLRAFSGMLDGQWDVAGFAAPVFDRDVRDREWIAGEAELDGITASIARLEAGATPARAVLAALRSRHADELAALRTRHAGRRRDRATARAATADPGARHALDQQSRGDAAEKRRVLARHAEELAAIAAEVARHDAELRALDEQRASRSRALFDHVLASYVLANARGERASIRDVFAPVLPPGGAGDCAAPKLFAEAYRHGLRPVALAELWLGPPPATGGRHHGTFYPACRGKCGPVLTFMLQGLNVEPDPLYGAAAIDDAEPRVVFEDDAIVVVDKPVGLLSVPGRDAALADSVLARLRRRHPGATGPLLVHRLDLDTSGLLVAAKHADVHAALQAQFARREVSKRYEAWLDGAIAGDRGTIELALRVDLDDRPRQIVDPVHGKPAITDWVVVERAGHRTKVALVPRTGRTHQLRVHCAHPAGLGAPIAGDRLYGRASDAPRLLLHAAALAFVHPRTGARVEVASPAPF